MYLRTEYFILDDTQAFRPVTATDDGDLSDFVSRWPLNCTDYMATL